MPHGLSDMSNGAPVPRPIAVERTTARIARAIRPATEADLATMAAIHLRNHGAPVGRGRLADIGRSFLERGYYRRLLQSPLGRAQVLALAGRVAGFVAYSPDAEPLHRAVRPSITSAPFLLGALVRHPRALAEVVGRPRGGHDRPDIRAEIMALEVDGSYEGLGFGECLLERAVGDLRRDGVRAIKARIADGQDALERLYLGFGFRRDGGFSAHQRAWWLLVWDGSTERTPA